MALTITYDGYGVVANADRETNDTGGSGTGDWNELGGGTIGFNPDVYLFEGGADGAGSMGSKYASKAGYSYIDGITALNFTGAGGNAENDFIYMWVNIQSAGAFLTLANDGLSGMIGSATGDSRHWKIAGSDDSNGWTGGWKCFVIDPQIVTGTVLNGTPVLTAIDTLGIWIDTNVSVRADSIFQAQIFAAKGLSITGTPTTSGDGLNEIVNWATDYTNRSFGGFEKRGNTYFQKGGLEIGDGTTSTTLTAGGNNVECEESSFWNGTAWVSSYPSDANKITTLANASLSFTNVNWSGYTSNKLQWDTSLGNASSVSGGTLRLLGSWSVKSTDTFNGVVFSVNDALSSGDASYDNCTFVQCGTFTVASTVTSFDNNIFKPATSITPISVSTLDILIENDFTSGGSGHAVELTGAAGSYDWDCTGTGYDSGTAGSGVEVTGGSITGDEHIHITATTGTFIINVSATATTPSVSSAGAVVNVVAGAVTLKFIVKDNTQTEVVGAYAYIDDNNSTPFILNTTTDVNGEASVSHSAGAVLGSTWRIRKYGYKPFIQTVDIGGIDITLPVTLIVDPQQT